MKEAIKRIENLLHMEEGREEKDGAGVYVPLNMDAGIRKKAFRECLTILNEEDAKNG